MTIFGIDISNNNGVVDIGRVKAEGFDFVFAKVTEGAGFRDQYWGRTREWCKSLGVLVAGYHYVKTDDPARQAELFVNQLGDKTIPAMLDFEADSGNIGNFWAVLNAIEARGVHVALSYIPRWYWSKIGAPDISAVPGLIQSSYVGGGSAPASAMYPGDGTFYWAGFGGRAVDILQFTDKAIVAGQSLDANAYQGTRDQFRALLGGVPGEVEDMQADERQWLREVRDKMLAYPDVPEIAGKWRSRARYAEDPNAPVDDTAGILLNGDGNIWDIGCELGAMAGDPGSRAAIAKRAREHPEDRRAVFFAQKYPVGA